MNDPIEDRLVRAGAAWRADQPPSRAVRPRRERRWLPAVAAAAVVMVAAGAVGLARLAGEDGPRQVADPQGAWEPMTASPLSPRHGAVVVPIAPDEVLVLGGDASPACPPAASCAVGPPPLRDGARYDVEARSWTPVAAAPLPLRTSSSAVLDGVVYLWVQRAADPSAFEALLAYDVAKDAWSTLPDPPVREAYLSLTAAGDRLVASYGVVGSPTTGDLTYDPATRTWATLPPAPYAPAFDRTMVWTGDQLVLVAAADAGETGPPFVRSAVLEKGAWRELPPQEVVIGGYPEWTWAGGRVVSAYAETADGGQTDGFGRAYPGGGELDPATGTWTALPDAPAVAQTYDGPSAAGTRYVTRGRGLVLDAVDDRWLELPPQPDAATQGSGAAWAGDRLVVWGGADLSGVTPTGGEQRVLATGAVWTPPPGRG